MRQFLIYMSIPAVALVAAWMVTQFDLLKVADTDELPNSAVLRTDPKLDRTISGMADVSSWQHPDKMQAVDRPGMTFRFTMPKETQQRFRDLRSRRVIFGLGWTNIDIAIDDYAALPALVRMRGRTSLEFDRKSFNVNLLSPQRFNDDFYSNQIYLLSLSRDEMGFEMRSANLLLAQMELFPNYHQYAILEINGQSQGLYMAIERPQDAILRTHENVVSIIRKRPEFEFQEKYSVAGVEPRKILRMVEAALHIENKEEQAERLARLVDLDAYMTLLAFNSLVQNADSGDEIFLFEIRDNPNVVGRLGVMGWDFDDLQQEPAHPEWVTDDPLCWAAEGWLDATILSNPILYHQFKQRLDLLLHELNDEVILRTIEKVRGELQLVSSSLSTIETPEFCQQRKSGLSEFRDALIARKNLLQSRLTSSDLAPAGR